jgi:hypothetical protein
MGFSPVAEIISKIYDCNIILVELQTVVFIIVFIPANFFVIWLMNIYGLRVTLITGSIFLITGSWLRLLLLDLSEIFALVTIGTILASTA